MRVAVVTGAAQDIGRRVAEKLAEQGYALALNDLRFSPETPAAVRPSNSETLRLTGDISDEIVVSTLAEDVQRKWGRVDVLVNNAGISSIVAAEHKSPAQFRRVLEIN